MHKSLLISALLASVALPAMAADMPVKAPIQQRPVFIDWSGFYIGAHGGYGWGNDDFNNPNSFFAQGDLTLSNIKSKGFVFGGHFGYNQQWGNLVGGIEADISTTGIKGSTERTATRTLDLGGGFREVDRATSGLNDKFNLLGSVRGRFGFLVGQSFLLYGTGGLGFTQFTQGSNFRLRQELFQGNTSLAFVDQSFTSSETDWRFGFVLGVGGEYRLTDNLFLGVEFLHYDFGKSREEFAQTISQTGFPTQTFAATADRLTTDVVRGRLSWKFTGGPIQ